MDAKDTFYLDNSYDNKIFEFSEKVTNYQLKDYSEYEKFKENIREELDRGHFACGYFAFELGYYFHDLEPKHKCELLADIHIFRKKNEINQFPFASKDFSKELDINFTEDLASYAHGFKQIINQIKEGETYQVNYTFPTNVYYNGCEEELYLFLRDKQKVKYGAFLRSTDRGILSFSPELFLSKVGTKVTTRPMKGSLKKSKCVIEDEYIKKYLLDSKNKAENLMIVDLLRNDLSQVCKAGTVSVDSIFNIEEYETLYQMTSEISGDVLEGADFFDILEKTFPCGSITGAPKRRTLEIINEVESTQRGIYTGAIGCIEPNQDFCFNVPIRTLVTQQPGIATYSIGSGIIYEADMKSEYDECLLKSKFLVDEPGHLYLFETMLFDGVISHKEAHITRLLKSCEELKFEFMPQKIRNFIHKLELEIVDTKIVKVKVFPSGSICYEERPFEKESKADDNLQKVKFSDSIVSEHTYPYLKYKTSFRSLYDFEYKAAKKEGYYDVLYRTENGVVTEATRNNLFVVDQNNKWKTPKLSNVVLPGVMRALVIKEEDAIEADIRLSDIKSAKEIYLTNSVRGRVRVELA